MPELPEVEVVRAGLAPAVTGATVTAVEVFDERSLRRHDGPSEDFVDRLVGSMFLPPERRGKFLWIPLASSPKTRENIADFARDHLSVTVSPEVPSFSAEALVIHLGMSGQVLLREPTAALDRLTRIRIDIEHPQHGALRIDFVDQRIFGSMAIDTLVETPDVPGQRIPSQVAHIARDPLDPAFDDARFLGSLAKRNTGIKRALLDQTLISGIGNICSSALRPADLDAQPSAGEGPSRRGEAGARQGARRGWDKLRRAVRERQWGIRILFALAQRLWSARPALPALRSSPRARAVHEPRLALLPALPASARGVIVLAQLPMVFFQAPV
jgi:DNA-formamidopyrimidine glycosylase